MSRSVPPIASDSPTVAPAHESGLGRIVRNSAFNAVGTILIVPSNMLALFVMAQRLGAQPIGTFFTIFSISAVIHWIADAGTTTVLTRHVARNPQRLKTIIPESLGVLCVVCCVSTTLFMLVAVPWMSFFTDRVSFAVVIVAASAMWSRHALDFAASALRGLERFEYENFARVVQTCSFCVFVWLWVHPSTGGALAAFIAYAASNVIAAIIIWWTLLTKWDCAGFRLNREIIKRWWTESIPLGAGDVIRQFLMQMDTLLLAAYKPQAIVGMFSIAARPLQPLQLLPKIIVSVTFPMLSRAAQVDLAAVNRLFVKTTKILWTASLPISIGLSMAAQPIILATAGEDFIDAARPLQILIWSTGLIFINAQLRFVLTALDSEKAYWRLICWTLAVKLGLEAALIPLWGLYGACIGNILGEIALGIGGALALHRLGVKSPNWLDFLRPAPAAIAMTLIMWPYANHDASLLSVIIAGVAGGVVYAIVALFSGIVPWSDLQRIWRSLRKPAIVASLEPAAVVAVAETADAIPN
ncbi:oligosaccharide flippase family protein [Lacipirellula sp.]|uniref:oligosaccharide flippase family protein n=1 Tax=Lacipirellula sp. TaxID=2691419 RepID=UPI003D101991